MEDAKDHLEGKLASKFSPKSERKLLQSGPGQIIRQAQVAGEELVNAAYQTIGNIFEEILGEDFADSIPEEWQLPTNILDEEPDFDVEKAYKKYANVFDFGSLAKAKSIKDVYDYIVDIEKDFCTKEEFTKGEKVPTECTGPSISLALSPKVCVVDDLTKAVTCDPAKLVLTKSPGSCTLKHKEPPSFTGKECLIEKEFGKSADASIGGRDFTISLGKVDFEAIKKEIASLVPDSRDVNQLLKLVF